MPRCATSCGDSRAASFHRRSPKKGTSLFATFLCFLLFFFFSLEAFPVAADAVSESGLAYGCPLDCGTGGICIPDTTFGALSAQYHSETASFRCDCFRGYTGTLCQINKDKSVANADHIDDSSSERGDDDFFPEDFFLSSDGCPFDCQNEGKCISIFGGLSYACFCIEPFWGSLCEINGLSVACELDCSSIISSGPLQGIGINDASQPKQGAFCVESPNGVDDVDDQTCVHCEEISEEDEPNCEGLIECKNGGVCKIAYLFTRVIATDSSAGNDATTERPLKCSSTVTMPIYGIDGTTMETAWMDLPPYVLSCDCQPGFQGETCEEIDVCGGCQNDGYCISKDTPGDKFTDDDTFNFVTDDSNFNDDDVFHDDDDDDGFDDDDNDDYSIDSPIFSDSDCTCYYGKCDQNLCGTAASCIGGMCNQDYLISPMCSGGKCSQRHTTNATCIGGDCDQTSAVEATCTGSDCFYDDIEAQTMSPATGTMAPGFEPFCSCGYGYYGKLCQHTITTICLFDELGYNQLLHEFCLKADGFCPLDVGGPFAVGERFCINGGTCGNIRDIVMATEPDSNGVFSCDCPRGFDGVHCEVVNTQAPSAGPTIQLPTEIELVSPSTSASLPRKWHTLVFVVPFVVFSF